MGRDIGADNRHSAVSGPETRYPEHRPMAGIDWFVVDIGYHRWWGCGNGCRVCLVRGCSLCDPVVGGGHFPEGNEIEAAGILALSGSSALVTSTLQQLILRTKFNPAGHWLWPSATSAIGWFLGLVVGIGVGYLVPGTLALRGAVGGAVGGLVLGLITWPALGRLLATVPVE